MADINPIKINAGSSKLENNVVNNYTTVSSIKTMQLNGIKNGLNDSEKVETEIYTIPSVEKSFLDLFSPDMIHWNLIDAPNGENLT